MSLINESCQPMFGNAGTDTLFLEPCVQCVAEE